LETQSFPDLIPTCLPNDGAASRTANESLLKRSLKIFKFQSGVYTPDHRLPLAALLQMTLAYFKTPDPPLNSLRIHTDETIHNIMSLALKEDPMLY